LQAPEQFASGAGHWKAHFPPTHARPGSQTVPQAPQLAGSVMRSWQLPLHAISPFLQLTAQVPALHQSPGSQALPHAPQLARSVDRSRHTPAHAVSDTAQDVTHVPPTQAVPLRHTVPHAPQFVGSVANVTHTAPHWNWPVGHPPQPDRTAPPQRTSATTMPGTNRMVILP
jgi:hypothetical protein